MGQGQRTLSRDAIFRAVKDQVGSSLGRTLAACLYWSQYSQRVDNGMPAIWKTGAELGRELGCKSRTANEHLKRLGQMGFWALAYRPRPGHPSKVTWLLFSGQSLKFLALARTLVDEQTKPRRRAPKPAVESHESALCNDINNDTQQSALVTSKHCETAQETSSGHAKGFLLTKEQKASGGKKEPAQKILGKFQEDMILQAPKYVQASDDDLTFATSIHSILDHRELKQWDWSSAYTWKDIRELCHKLAKVGVSTPDERSDFLVKVLDNWHWLRLCMEYRYSSHDGNLHRPTPMALAAEAVTLQSSLAQKSSPQPKVASSSNFSSNLDVAW